MPISLPAVLMTLALQSPLEERPRECQEQVTHFILSPETEASERVVCVTEGVATSVLLDAALAKGRVVVQEAEDFERLDVGGSTLTLMPPKKARAGKRWKVEVHYGDGAFPTTVVLTLVATPWGATRQVEVHRQARTLESYQREVKELRRQLQELTQAREPRGRVEASPRGLLGLAAEGLLSGQDIKTRQFAQAATLSASEGYEVTRITSYSAPLPQDYAPGPERVRILLVLQVRNNRGGTWKGSAGMLTGPKGTEPRPVEVWQKESLGPGQKGVVAAEAEVSVAEARLEWGLSLWNETGDQLLSVGSITFP